MFQTWLTDTLGIRYPIIQDGMGTYGTAKLAAAVTNAGGLGTLSQPGMAIDDVEIRRRVRRQIDLAMERTDGVLAMNFGVGLLATGELLPATLATFEGLLEARASDNAIERQLRVLITSAGFPGDITARAQEAGLVHIHKVGSPRHAVKVVDHGVDAVIASGFEMGGHTHATPISTLVLAPEVIRSVDAPVIVSGGIKDGRGLAAALAMGAAGVAMGTRFVATADNEDWHDNYRQRVLSVTARDIIEVSGVWGPLHGIRNEFTRQLAEAEASGEWNESDLVAWKDRALIAAERDGDMVEGMAPLGVVAAFIDDLPRAEDLLKGMVADAQGLLQDAQSSLTA